MTITSKKQLETKAEYNKIKSVQDKRVVNNRLRRQAIAAGKASVGDGTNIDHKVPMDKGGSGDKSNTRVVSEATNKGWRKEHPDMYTKGKGK